MIGNIGISNTSRITGNVKQTQEISIAGDIIRNPFTTTVEPSTTFAEVLQKLRTELKIDKLETVLQYQGTAIQTNITIGQFYEEHTDIVGTPLFELKTTILGGSI